MEREKRRTTMRYCENCNRYFEDDEIAMGYRCPRCECLMEEDEQEEGEDES